jgi:hypothetical protein
MHAPGVRSGLHVAGSPSSRVGEEHDEAAAIDAAAKRTNRRSTMRDVTAAAGRRAGARGARACGGVTVECVTTRGDRVKLAFRGAVLALGVSIPIYTILALFLGTARKAYVGSGGQGFDPGRVPISALGACAITLVLGLMLAFGRRRPATTVGVAAATGALANAGFAIGACEMQLESPLWYDWHAGWEPSLGWDAVVALTLVGTVAGALVFFAMRDRRRTLLFPAVALALSAVTVAAAAISTRRPQPDDFRVLFERHPLREGVEVAVGPLGFEARGDELLVRRPGGALRDENQWHEPVPTAIERDPVTGIVAGVTANDSSAAASPILSARGDRPYSEIGISDFRGRLGAPRAWVWGAVAGLVLGCAALGLAGFIRRRTEAFLATAIDAEQADGWVRMKDRPPVFVASTKAQPPGHVLVQLRRESTAGYRDAGTAEVERVTPGTREAWQSRSASYAHAWACVALGAALMTSAPLWVAWGHHLLW